MEYKYELKKKKFFKRLTTTRVVVDEDTKIKEVLELAYRMISNDTLKDEKFLKYIDEDIIEKAIDKVENFDDNKCFWDEIISLEYLKDNLKLLSPVEAEDDEIDELF